MTINDQSWRRLGQVTTAKFDVDWQVVYQQELPRIYNYFRYRFGDDAVAEDLTAVTFEKAWRARERYRRDLAAFSTWLLTIARNVATDRYRAERTGRSMHRAEVPLDLLEQQPAPDTPHELYARQAELDRLGALLALLPERDRELVALKYGAQQTNREIARQLGLSESNVGTLLHRIITKLRAQWED
jgi:RNA polymerase sigma-70 factor (ECF subfamily)